MRALLSVMSALTSFSVASQAFADVGPKCSTAAAAGTPTQGWLIGLAMLLGASVLLLRRPKN